MEQKMKQTTKMTAAIFAAFLLTFVLAILAPTIDAMEARAKAQAEQEKIANDIIQVEQAAEETYGSMTDEQRMEGVVYE